MGVRLRDAAVLGLEAVGWTPRAGCVRIALITTSALTVLFVSAPQVFANGNVEVTIDGVGKGSVTGSTSGAVSPGSIDCQYDGAHQSGTCAATVIGGGSGFTPFFTTVTLRATSGAGAYFVGWAESGATGAKRCTTPPGEDATCELELHDPSATPTLTSAVTATFAPLPGQPPVATGGTGAGAEAWLRTLNGMVRPERFKLNECFFEYGATTAYGTKAPCDEGDWEADEGSAPVPVEASTEPLEYETTYHYRLVASNIGGVSKGEDRTFTTGPVPLGTCPNEARRFEQGIKSLLLPDCMALEMVSPPQKAGQPAQLPNLSLDGLRMSFVSAASLGENPPPGINTGGALYVAGRGDSGWTTERTLPEAGLRALWDTTVNQGKASFTPDFSHWLGIGATSVQLEQGTFQAYDAGVGGFLRWLSAPLVPLTLGTSIEGNRFVAYNSEFRGASADHARLYFKPGAPAAQGGGVPTTYLPYDPKLSGPEHEIDNTYLVAMDGEGQPAQKPDLLQYDESGKVWGGECGARLGGIGPAFNSTSPAPNGDRNQGAVSADGARTYFSARAAQPQTGPCLASSKLRILQRLETPRGPQISELFRNECTRHLPEEPCGTADGDDLYQGASLDQRKVYFTTNRQLTDTDRDGSSVECDRHGFVGEPLVAAGCDLYLYDSSRPAGEHLIQVSAGEDLPSGASPTVHERGSDAKVYNAITAISADGSRAYFVATGVLTDSPNFEGRTAVAGQPNLYMWDEEAWEAKGEEGGLRFIGTLDLSDAIDLSPAYNEGLWGGQGTWKNHAYPVPALSPAEQRGDGDAEEGGDGHVLVFETHASLAENDADGGHLDVYRYDADVGTLECVSCAPGSSASQPDEAPFDVQSRGGRAAGGPLGTDFAELQRWVSEDGEEVVFITAQGLLPGDVNGVGDVYLWRSGELYRLPAPGSGTGSATATKPVLAPDGATVAFVTAVPLLPQDGDTTLDVYVARVGGGIPNPPESVPCQPGSNCQPALAEPAVPQTGSEASQANAKPNRCATSARRARALSKRAGRLRRQARHAARQNPHRTKALRRKAHRLGKHALRLSKRAKRCRTGRPESKQANARRNGDRSLHRRGGSADRGRHRRGAR